MDAPEHLAAGMQHLAAQASGDQILAVHAGHETQAQADVSAGDNRGDGTSPASRRSMAVSRAHRWVASGPR